MATPYQRGTAFEHRVKAELEKAGYLVMRSPGSKSPSDLVAIPPVSGPGSWVLDGRPLLVQCKLRGVISRAERKALRELAAKYMATSILAYALQQRGMVHFKVLLDNEDRDWSP